MGHVDFTLTPLLIITLLALLTPILLHRLRFLRIPVVVGEIVCGIIVGRSGFNIIQPSQWLDFLSLLGFTYLMFLSGLEIDFSMVTGGGISGKKNRGSPLTLALVMFAGTMALSLAAAYGFKHAGLVRPPTHITILALLLGTTSVGVVMPTLKESGLVHQRLGQTLLMASVVADFATILLATYAIVLLAPNRSGTGTAAIIALGTAFYIVYRLGVRFMEAPLIRRFYLELAHTSAQLRVRTAFALMLLMAVLSQVVGVEVVLGAFVAGAIFSVLFRGESWEDEIKFDAIGYGFFIPIFFIMVGVRLDLSVLWQGQNAWRLFLLLGAALVVKMLPALMLWPGHGLRAAFAGGFLLSGRLSLIIAFAQVAVVAGLLEPDMNAIAVVIALVTCMGAPVGFMRLQREGTAGFDAGIGILILGAGKVGRLLGQRFYERRHKVALIDFDTRAVAKAHRLGLEAHEYRSLDEQTLIDAGIRSAHTFVAVTNDDEVNLNACLLVRDKFGLRNLVARIGNPDNAPVFSQQGIRPMNTTLASVVTLENLIYRPNVFSMLSHEDENMEVLEVIVTNPAIAGRSIKDIEFPDETLVLMVRRGEITSMPHGNSILELGDVLTLFVRVNSMVEIAQLFEPGRPDQHLHLNDDML